MREFLPDDWQDGTFLGRLNLRDGPTPVWIKGGKVYDLTPHYATVTDALNDRLRKANPSLPLIYGMDEIDPTQLLSPVDLQCLKAAGVTFAISVIERVIEERAKGDADKAASLRSVLKDQIGAELSSVKPGSDEAQKLKSALIEAGLWSQYLEVAIGPDAEIFTKGPVLSSVGFGADIGIRDDSHWNNPEPEVVLSVNRHGEIMGAMLGNDVNLRCFEGRSALLLGKAKDNNASCALGPFARLFDDGFGLSDIRNAEVDLRIEGADGFVLTGQNLMRHIARDPTELVKQAMAQHQYPDGFILMCGTLFAPIEDRDTAGKGFTHKVGDVVRIKSQRFGTLINQVTYCNDAAPWEFGISDLMRNLASRGLLNTQPIVNGISA